MENTRLPKCVMFGELGGAGCVGGQEKEWMGCSLDDLRAFGMNADQWTTAAQDEGEWRRTAEHFMAKWIAAEEARAGLRHAVVCPNVTGRTKERIAQASGLVLARPPLLTSHKWRELVSSACLVCGCHDVFLWCYVCFVLLCFRFHAFVEAAALRSIVLRYARAPIVARVFFFLFVFWNAAFSEFRRFLFV